MTFRGIFLRSNARSVVHTRLRWRWPVAWAAAVAIAGALAAAPAIARAQQPGAWPMFQGGADHLGDATGLAPLPPLKATWRTRSPDRRPEPLSGVVLVAGAAVAVSLTHVVAFDPGTGAEMWRLGRARGPLTTPAADPAAGAHGILVYTEGDAAKSAVVAVDLSTRERLWRVGLKQPLFGAPAIAGGRVYVGGQDQYVYAVDVESGHLDWKKRLDGEVNGSPAVAGDTVVVAAEVSGGGRARLYALDAGTGTIRWSFSQIGGTGVSSATVAQGSVFVGFPDHTVRAFDLRTGAERWSQPVRGGFGPVLGFAVSAGALYVPDADGALYRFDVSTGHRAWVFQFPDVSYGASPLVVGRFVYLGSRDGTLGAVDVSNGTLAWKTRFADPARGLTPAGDRLLVAFVNGPGGVAALRHDPAGHLTAEDSPTTLHVPVALAGFGAVFVVLTVAILTAFRLLSPDRRRGTEQPTDDLEAEPPESAGDGEP